MPGDVAQLDFCYLTTTGRLSGNPHRIEIWFVLAEETVFLAGGTVTGATGSATSWPRRTSNSSSARKRTTRARVVEDGSEDDASPGD